MKNYTPKAKLARLVRECDRWWRRLILLRAGGECEICGISEPRNGEIIWLQACHIISRTYWSTRWHPRNGVCGCQDCHDDKTIMAWLKETDRQRYNWIIQQKRRQVSHRDIDLEKILKDLQAA